MILSVARHDCPYRSDRQLVIDWFCDVEAAASQKATFRPGFTMGAGQLTGTGRKRLVRFGAQAAEMRTFPAVLNAALINVVFFEPRQLPFPGNANHAVNPAIKIINIIALLRCTYQPCAC